MEIVEVIKIALMLAFFSEVVIFGKFISNLKCFKEGSVMSVAMTFSGTLFLSIALLDIIPEAIANFDAYLDSKANHEHSQNSLHSNSNLPLTMIIAMFTFLIIMYIDKILIGHSHDHEYELSFISEPRKTQKENEEEMKQEQVTSENQIEAHEQTNYRPFILQAGMSLHAFFECLAVGLQKTPIGVFGLASAILVHKWAEGLTLGLIYKKEGFKKKTTTIMIIVQGLINVVGLITGTIIMNQGNFLTAFFMSISAGTFLYISLGQVLIEQIVSMNKRKAAAMLVANLFLAFLVVFEKNQEKKVQNQ